MDPEIRKMMVLSTSHLTEAWADILDNAKPGAEWADRVDSGYFCHVPPEQSTDESEYPEFIQPVLAFARQHGCDNIRFDCDGPVMEGLPTFLW